MGIQIKSLTLAAKYAFVKKAEYHHIKLKFYQMWKKET